MDMIVGFIWGLIMWLIPVVATIILGYVAWKLWVHYIRQNFISGIEWSMLEITPPRDVLRSPKGMELFITNALYHWSEKGGKEEYWQGAVWFWHSLEIASIDGNVHFYIRTPSRIRELVETQMYAQYPQAQVRVVEDYTLGVDKITKDSDWRLWGCEFRLEKPDVFPLKTYVDFGLDKDPKEEFKVDPISSVIELFGSIQKGEQMWMQIVVRPSKQEYGGGLFKKGHDWVVEGTEVIKKVLEPYTGSKARAEADPIGGISKEIRAPGFLDEMIKASGRKMTKLGFDTGVRICYVARKEIFPFPFGPRNNNSRNIRLIFRQYANPFSNQWMRFNNTQADAYNSYFTASPETIIIMCNRMLNEYRERMFFYPPLRHYIFNKHTVFFPLNLWVKPFFHSEIFVLNTEELATMWHFPGQILKVPSFERIESIEAAPPPNLPM